MKVKIKNIMSPEEHAFWEAMSYYQELQEYIEQRGGRFFFGHNENGKRFFDKLVRLLPYLKKTYQAGVVCHRARIVECRTGDYTGDNGVFEAFSEKELSAPPPEKATEGRMNPQKVSYLYLADSRRCALAETRPTISSLVAIAKGNICRDIVVASFVDVTWSGITLFEKNFVDLVEWIFSKPLNNQKIVEYLPSQVVAEYIRLCGFDGIEYGSSQYKGGVNLALFNANDWLATSSILFEVEDIKYTAVRARDMVEIFGCPDEEL